MEENNNILSRYDAVAKQAVNFGIDAQRYFTVFDLKCQIALALGADVQEVKDCLSVYDVDYLIYKTYGGQLSKLDLMSDYDVLVATIGVLNSAVDTSIIDSEYIAEKSLIGLLVKPQPLENNYFYVEALSDNTQFSVNHTDGAPVLNLEYSMDGKTWQSWDYDFNNISANAKERVYLRGQNEEWTDFGGDEDFLDTYLYNSIITMNDVQFNIGGRLSSLFTGNDEESDKSIIMSTIFRNSACVDASELIVPKNAKLSYAFCGCRYLISAPRILSDIITHDKQYMSMFDGCSSLTNAPELPAMSLTRNCYTALFARCSSLLEAPQLPATSLAPYCYSLLFRRCSSLLEAPQLPATSLEEGCYFSLFSECSSLTNAPELPATTLARRCYASLFEYCTSLVRAPQLPATSLEQDCYSEMFSDCSSLVEGPRLLAETTAYSCCYQMFWHCTSLTSFDFGDQGILADETDCFYQMFFGCSKLSYIRCIYDRWDTTGPRNYEDWTSGVAPQGTFVTNTDKWQRGVNGIPNGWEVVIEGTTA